jgi:hypothetical protein
MKIPLLEFLTGAAGTGKTTLLKKRVKDFKERTRSYATLMATTGIAAINLSGANGETVTTVNSGLKYFDTNSLKDNFASKRLHGSLKKVSKQSKNIAIEEISMMDCEQLDIICDALAEVNELQEVHNRGGLGLVVCGDFCQLPPVKGEFCFNGRWWKEFKVTKLTKIWRQSDEEFLKMLNAARCGDGVLTSKLAYEIPGISLAPIIDSHFDGTTIVPLNKYVDSLNKIRLDELIKEGKRVWEFSSFRWGRQLSEWSNIPEKRIVCKDAYVMILANDAPNFSYANGSCGHVLEADIDSGTVYVKLASGSMGEVKVRKVTRRCMQKETPDGCIAVQDWMSKGEWKEKQKGTEEHESDEFFSEETLDIMYRTYISQLTSEHKAKVGPCQPYFDFDEAKWVIGEITYTPIRLAYATTVHKCVSIDSLVMTMEGLKYAEDVRIGESIWDGSQYTEIADKAYKESILTEILTETGLEIKISPEHPILTDKGFVFAKNIQACDKVKLTDLGALPSRGRILKSEVDKENNLYWLLGALVGDGSYTDFKEGNIHFSNSSEFLQNKMKEIVESRGYHYGIRSDKRGGFWTSKPFRLELEKLGLDYVTARSKTIPNAALKNTETLRFFLQGLMDTDGSVRNNLNGYVITVIGRQLSKQVQLAFMSLGIPARRKFYTTDYSDYYQININGEGIKKFKDLVNFTRPDKVQKSEKCCVNRLITKYDGWDIVTKKSETQNVYPVVNFSTNTEKFAVGGIVTHNSQGLSLDKVQIDYSNAFFGEPSMSYVALSRCRTPEGLTIVGSKKLIEDRTNISSEISDWL